MTPFEFIGKAVGDYLAALQLFFDKMRISVRDGVNDSEVLKDGGSIGIIDQNAARKRIIDLEFDPITPTNTAATNYVQGSGLPADGTVGSLITTLNSLVYPGFVFTVKSLIISSSGPCSVKIIITAVGTTISGLQKTATTQYASFGLNGGIWSLDLNEMDIREGGGISVEFYRTTVTTPIVSIYSSAKMTTDESNYSAKLVWMGMGDSITWGTLGNVGGSGALNKGNTHYSKRIVKRLKELGFDVRLSLRGMGGSTTASWVEAIDNGRIANMRPNLVTIGLGTNDALTGNAVFTDFTNKMKYILRYIFSQLSDPKVNPNISVILLGNPPMTDINRAPNAQSYRDAMAQIVSSKGDGEFTGKDLLYYDQTTNFPVVVSNFVETASNTWVHPRGDTGHAIIAAGLLPVIEQTKFYIENYEV